MKKLPLDLATPFLPAAASAAVTCPPTVPTFTQTGPTTERLTNIAIWNANLREPIDSAAPPALVPDSTRPAGATLIATSHLAGTATERDDLACTYTPPHLLLFDITGLTTSCRPYPKPQPPSPPPAAETPYSTKPSSTSCGSS